MVMAFDYNVSLFKKLDKLTLILLIVLFAFSISNIAYAEEQKLTDIFYTKSFEGSWEVINKFNWVGMALNFLISAVSVLGLCSVMSQRMITLLYMSSKPLFDTVYDIKNEAKGSRFLGFEGIVRNVSVGNRGVGFDAIVGFFYSLLPNVKAYSDYNPERTLQGLSEDDTVPTYMLKTLLPTVLLVFFFSMGFNGTLARGYGTIVNGMSAVADRAVDVNLEAYVNRIMNTGESYTFTIGSNNTPEGKLAEKISRDIYGKVLSRITIIDTETRMIVGRNVENWVWDNVLGGGYGQTAYAKLNSLVGQTSGMDDIAVSSGSDVSALRYDIIVNTGTLSGLGVSKSLISFVQGGDYTVETTNSVAESLNVHLVLRKDRVTEADFFIRRSD